MRALVFGPLLLLVVVVLYGVFEVHILSSVLPTCEDGLVCKWGVKRLSDAGEDDILLGLLNAPSSRARLFAMESLVAGDNEEAWLRLPSMIDDPDREVRLTAVTLCGEKKIEAAIPHLVAYLRRNPDYKEKKLLWKVLLGMPREALLKNVTLLCELWKEGDGEVRSKIEPVLYELATPSLRAFYRERTKAGSPDAVKTLAKVAAPSDVELLERLFFEEKVYPRRRWVLLQALRTIMGDAKVKRWLSSSISSLEREEKRLEETYGRERAGLGRLKKGTPLYAETLKKVGQLRSELGDVRTRLSSCRTALKWLEKGNGKQGSSGR